MEEEPKIINVGQLGNSQNTRVIDSSGISYAVTNGEKDGVPKIEEARAIGRERTEEEKLRRRLYGDKGAKFSQGKQMCLLGDITGCLTTIPTKDNLIAIMIQQDNYLAIPEATAKGYAEAYEGDSVNLAVPNSLTRRGRVGKQIANTLDTGCQQGVVEKWQSVVGNKQLNPFRGSVDEYSPCITSACGAGGGMTPMLTNADIETTKSKEFIEQIRGHKKMEYRIRKLTPKECFRLMDVDDEDIDKIQAAGISNSQQYKMAGNSIVVACLYHLFRKMFTETHNEDRQLTLW